MSYKLIAIDMDGTLITSDKKITERSIRAMQEAEAAGAYVAKVALMRRSSPLKALGLPYKGAALLAKFLPRRTSNYIVGRMYSK